MLTKQHSSALQGMPAVAATAVAATAVAATAVAATAVADNEDK